MLLVSRVKALEIPRTAAKRGNDREGARLLPLAALSTLRPLFCGRAQGEGSVLAGMERVRMLSPATESNSERSPVHDLTKKISTDTNTGRQPAMIAAAFLCLSGILGLSEQALAGGFFLYEVGIPDVCLASAGYASRAQDASTVFTNPAGMTRLDHSEVMIGVQPYYGYQVFSTNHHTTTTGSDGGNALVPLPSRSFFFVYSLSPKLKLGIANVTYFGGAIEYNLNWVGRYHLQGATMLGNSTLPSIAYRINRWLSVGAGFNIMIGYLKEKVAIKNLEPGLPDGQLNSMAGGPRVWGAISGSWSSPPRIPASVSST